MNETFRAYVESLQPSVDRLLSCSPFKFAELPKQMPRAGVYLFSEGIEHLYVGRTNGLRQRMQQHCRPSSSHDSAPFAFLLARIAHGSLKPTYKRKGSRKELCKMPEFMAQFQAAKARLREMDIRFVEEAHPLTQALLEMYVAVTLKTSHNDFDNH